jgi:hypothetical protein
MNIWCSSSFPAIPSNNHLSENFFDGITKPRPTQLCEQIGHVVTKPLVANDSTGVLNQSDSICPRQKQMRPTRLLLSLGLLTSTGLSAHPPVSPHAQKVVETIRQLRSIGLPPSDELEGGPPAKVPGLLRALNQELKALIIEDLNDHARHAVPGEDEILEQLTAAGWEEIPSHKWNAYGEIGQIKFDWKTEYDPGILIVSTQLWLPCGSIDPDSAIYVFRGMARQWQLVLAVESDFNPTGDRDETGMQYRISPPDTNGHWFLVLARVPPSCRRPHNVLRYKALKPGPNPEEPIVLLSGRETTSPFFEPPFRINVESDWFAITHGGLRKLDGEPGIAVLRYDLSDYLVRRVAPVALTPEDFLDQWAQMSWDEARRWTRPISDSSLREWHQKLSGLASDSTEIESVRRCSGTAESDQKWLLELSIDERLNPSLSDQYLYVEVAKRSGIFSLDAVYKSHPRGCAGKTPLTPMVDHELPSW